jgi:hypothetical protein
MLVGGAVETAPFFGMESATNAAAMGRKFGITPDRNRDRI